MAATMIKAHKIRLNPTPEQEDYLRRAAGTRRFCYNWGLAEWNKQYAEFTEGKREKKPTACSWKGCTDPSRIVAQAGRKTACGADVRPKSVADLKARCDG